ncbi:hypothetical protein O181_006523 [Austropuccinia psidii MF-1]|uniref:Uncharacterized protein n=1 Tax=Austropuccinia psidii MF-1 TaxID=1389203 RepID=A0A9Q3GGN5_9BASI|nr:hypothetical protein [Austropuccinia psidii MF-1]
MADDSTTSPDNVGKHTQNNAPTEKMDQNDKYPTARSTRGRVRHRTGRNHGHDHQSETTLEGGGGGFWRSRGRSRGRGRGQRGRYSKANRGARAEGGYNSSQNPRDTPAPANTSQDSSTSRQSQSLADEDESVEQDRHGDGGQEGDDNHEENGNIDANEAGKSAENEGTDEETSAKKSGKDSQSSRRHKQNSDTANTPPAKPHEKKEPYIRQVELPKEKLSTADLEAKMAAMALKNAKLLEQQKAADQDAAEYREIELKSQKAYEAQRLQQEEINAVRRVMRSPLEWFSSTNHIKVMNIQFLLMCSLCE